MDNTIQYLIYYISTSLGHLFLTLVILSLQPKLFFEAWFSAFL